MDSVSPVYTEDEVPAEKVIAIDQDTYLPIIILRVEFQDQDENLVSRGSVTRFRFTEEERAQIAAGADLLITQPHHGRMMPIAMQLAMPGEYPK